MQSLPQSDLSSNPEVRKLSEQVARVVESIAPAGATFAEREHVALEVTNEAVRVHLEQDLQTMADGYGEQVRVDNIVYKHHADGEVPYHSLCGDLRVHRATYRRMAEHNGPTVVPLDLEAGLIERATPALAYGVSVGYAKHEMRSHHEALINACRMPPSRTTLETMAKRMAKTAQRVAPRIEPYIRRSEKVPAQAHAISLGLDRTAVPMEEQRSPDASAKTPRKERKTPYVRTPPPPVDVQWRMAYVGTFSVVDRFGEALVTRRYAATANEGATSIVAQLMADVRGALRHEPNLNVGIIQDGAPELWTLLREALDNEPTVKSWLEGIDKYHLLERLGNALQLIEPNDTVRTNWLRLWRDNLDNSDTEIDIIESHLQKRYNELRGDKASKLWEHLVYIRNNKDRMRYASLARAGLPVGSGVTEGAAKSVVGLRAKGCGRRWSEPGLRGVLRLRALYCSDRFPAFWRYFSRRYTATVEEAVA